MMDDADVICRRSEGVTLNTQEGRERTFHALFETDHELVVVKPSGIASELSDDRRQASLISRIRSDRRQASSMHLPHRLDRVTRGLVVVALSEEAVRFHNEQLRTGQWDKLYLAHVHASPTGNRPALGLHKLYLRRQGRRSVVVRSGGRPAWTEIVAAQPLHGDSRVWQLLIRLHTGRMHQIRTTLAHLGTPLCGDWLYGRDGDDESSFYLEHIALRFTPYGENRPAWVHWPDDPTRPVLEKEVRYALDALLTAWENGQE